MNGNDSNRKVIPTIPGPRRSGENPKPQVPPQRTARVTPELVDFVIQAARQHDAYLIGYGGIQAHAAF